MHMPGTRDFGPLIHISAEAIGQPGQRRFRLRAMNDSGETATLWIEKEQLAALGDAIDTVLKDEGYAYQRLPLDDAQPEAVLPLNALVELQLTQLSMAVNTEAQRIVLIAAAVHQAPRTPTARPWNSTTGAGSSSAGRSGKSFPPAGLPAPCAPPQWIRRVTCA